MSKYICLLFFLFGCTPTTQKVQAELNGTYSWGNVFVAEEIKILDENFEFEAFSDCIGCGEIVDYPLKGRLNLEGETIIFDENKQYGSQRYRLVIFGKNSYLVGEGQYDEFIKSPNKLLRDRFNVIYRKND